MLLTFLVNLILSILGIVLGGYILLAGYRRLWVSLGVIGFTATANLLAILLASADSGWDLADQRRWLFLIAAGGVGALGLVIGRSRPEVAVTLVGFSAGVDMTLWLHNIWSYVFTTNTGLSEPTALWLLLVLGVVGGLLGLWLTRRYGEELLILITAVIGVEIIYLSLGLKQESSFTAVIILSLALVGVVVQYANFQRHAKAEASFRPPEPALPEIFPPDFLD